MNRILAAILIACVVVSVGRSESIEQDREYTIVNDQIDPIPLPFQAAVFRRAFQNRTDRMLTPEYPEHGAVIRKIKAPGAGEYRTARGSIIGAGRATVTYTTPLRTELVPLSLEPGTQSTIRHSFAADWLGDEGAVLFPEAGTYSFKLYYDDELRIVVREPEGDDKVILDQLRGNPELATKMMSPVTTPPEEMLRSLERIVMLYPESSYADYARYALARHYAHAPGGRGLRAVSDDHKIAVSELLKGIDASFAYAPDALVLLHRVLKSQGRDDAAADVMAKMQEICPDANEYLDYLADQLSDEQWIEQNPRRPTRIPDAPEPPTRRGP